MNPARNSKLPQWRKDGWTPNGPGKCKCPRCGRTCSTNALARSTHQCVPKAAMPMEDKSKGRE